jgi:DNA primase
VNVDTPRLLKALGIQIPSGHTYGDLWASCPYPDHEDADASWHIVSNPDSPKNGHNHCFGCKREGGALYLVMEVVGFSGYGAAHDYIVDKGLDLEESAALAAQIVLMKRAKRRPELPIPTGVRLGEPLGLWLTPARRYAKRRGLTLLQVAKWGLGYGVEGDLLGRLYLPIHDRWERLINWNARAFAGQEAKYKNPYASEGADMGAVFGQRYWPQDPSEETVVLTEGELNALAFERVGAKYIGGLGGSDIQPKQWLRISKFGRVLIATDGDMAGSVVAEQLRVGLARWRHAERIMFPPRLDACDIYDRSPVELEGMLMDVHG